MSNRIGFWSVLALVVGSQIGSGVFMSPANLAPFGIYSICGWVASAIGAIALAMVFASLCARFPKTGGPHVYIEKLFGRDIAFLSGWTYWVVSWVSTTAVIVAAIGYLSPLINSQDTMVYLVLEILLVLLMGFLNLFGVSVAGRAETLFTLLKFLPLFIVPVIAIWYFDLSNFQVSGEIAAQNVSTSIAQASLLTLWGFIGLESATTPAGSVENAKKTIPIAVVTGTIIVALIYIFNSVAIMGLIPGSELQESSAPYVDVARYIFGGQWHIWVSIAASIVCIGTINAWILTSGQISLGLAQDKMMPKLFSNVNSWKAPYASIIISCLGIVPLLILTANKNIAGQVAIVIDFSVTSFLFIYILCSIVHLVLSWRESSGVLSIITGIVAIIFCGWIIAETSLDTLLISALFTVSGIPLYFLWYRKIHTVN
ncbi:MAG: amino acid permease [Rickettsiales bacterium]|jgi:APA family basic amino acid/polyamine antiporter|nr:amino acid permease [Rickettsiales bacterium]